MVLAGHRFLYLPPNNTTFYNLDKLKKGEHIYVIWLGKLYTYTITASFIVLPDDTGIYADTNSPTLTLYTCTPLWTATRRLVITAMQNENM